MLSVTARLLIAGAIMLAAPHAGLLAQTAPQGAQQPAKQSNAAFAAILIKNTLVALNQANITGNYSVLRELGTVEFQGRNSSRGLARTFSSLRVDIKGVVNAVPQLSKPPVVNKGSLRLTGVMPLSATRVNFDLGFRFVNRQWRLHGMSVSVGQQDQNAKKQPSTSEQKN